MKRFSLFGLLILCNFLTFSQDEFHYEIVLEKIEISGLPALHSYAFGQYQDKWLIIGGRTEGLHARQPFAAFPASHNNTRIYVIDVASKAVYSAPLSSLSTSVSEQLQSTNMNFYQDADTLYIVGGYARSETAGRHITFPYLTSVQVSAVIDAIIGGKPIASYFKQITDEVFAVTGGQLGKIGNTFLLVGGHRFDGLYNPADGPSFSQTYTNQIRKFTINNTGQHLSYDNYETLTDPVHLRRRDYNLLPQVFPDGTQGYTISSGVFQQGSDLPFLYPVDISAHGYHPITDFNQYLSHYHGAKVALYDQQAGNMHSLFFGGMSQYYHDNEIMVRDDMVPFIKTISRLTRYADGSLREFRLQPDMPLLQGASAEFILNTALPHYPSKIIQLNEIDTDTILIGHIYGGILSPVLNPFFNFQTNLTSADSSLYAVNLIRISSLGINEIKRNNPFDFELYPNPAPRRFQMRYTLDRAVSVSYFLIDTSGKIIDKVTFGVQDAGHHNPYLTVHPEIPSGAFFVTLVFNRESFVTKKVIIQ